MKGFIKQEDGGERKEGGALPVCDIKCIFSLVKAQEVSADQI